MVAFPEQKTFQFVETSSNRPISNLAVLLTLLAHRKDDYHIGPAITDSNGIVVFTRTDCLKEIDISKTMFIMDYSSTLEQCLPKIVIEVMSKQAIDALIAARREHKDFFQKFADCTEPFFERLSSCVNRLYESNFYTFDEAVLNVPNPIAIPIRQIPIRESVPGK